MICDRESNDLLVLVPDLDIFKTTQCLLNRPESMGMHRVTFSIRRHPQRDAGCKCDAAESLRMSIRDHRYALVMFDKHGCGSPRASRERIQNDVENHLSQNGWEDRCKAIVIEPELEAWIWNGSSRVPRILGWEGDYASLRDWLENHQLWPTGSLKPADPKQAMEAVLRRKRIPRSSNLYRRLAETVAVDRCADPAFNELKTTLQYWFPRSDG